MTIQYESDLSDFQNLLANNSLVAVDFTASWCGPCKRIAPEFERLSGLYTNWTFRKVDVDEAEEITEAYGVSQMPTFIFFKDAQILEKLVGADAEALESKLKSV